MGGTSVGEDPDSGAQSPLEKMLQNAFQPERRFAFSLDGLEPEDIERILFAFTSVHVFKEGAGLGENDHEFSSIVRLCALRKLEPKFETRDYPALVRGQSFGHKIILLPDSGDSVENERKAIEVIKKFAGVEEKTILETVIALVEKFDPFDIVQYVEKYHHDSLSSAELIQFKARVLNRSQKK